MTAVFYALAFIFGTAIGSFLNVLILRYDPRRALFSARRLGGRSRCPNCGRTLGAAELVPVLSFIVQKGRCRGCGRRISLQYPAVELFSGLVFAGVPLFLNSFYGESSALFASLSLPVWYYCLVAAWTLAFVAWIAIAAIDLRHYVIPNELNLILLVIGAVVVFLLAEYGRALAPFHASFLAPYQLLFSPLRGVVANHFLGLAAGGGFFGFLVAVSRGRGMGLGDVKLAAAAGFLLGWPDIALATGLAFVLGGLLGLGFMIFRGKTMRDRIPFAPILIVGFALTVFYGAAIVSGYFQLSAL